MRNKKPRQLYRNDLITAVREARSMTQDALAQKADISRFTLMNIENKGTNTDAKTLTAIARELRIPLTLLFDFEVKLEMSVAEKVIEAAVDEHLERQKLLRRKAIA